MTFQEWWDSDPNRNVFHLSRLAGAAWEAAQIAERERCAKLCEEYANWLDEDKASQSGEMMARAYGVRQAANRIREA